MTGSDATMNLDTTPETHVQEITVSEPVTKSNLGALAAYKITPLEDDNWLAWKETIEDIFRVHKVIDHIEGTAKRPDGNDINALQAWEDAEDKAHMLLKINLKPSNVPHVTRARTTNVHEAWENLRTIHEMRTQVSTFINERNFLNMRMAEGDDVMHHITEMRKLQSQLLLMGSDIPESKFKFALVMSLPKSWRTWVQSYLGSSANDPGDSTKIRGYTSQELIAVIIDEYKRRLEEEDQDKGYYVKGEKTSKRRKVEPPQKKMSGAEACTICGRTNHVAAKCFYKGKPKCGSCGKFNHTTAECWGKEDPKSSMNKRKRKGKAPKERANQAHETKDELMDTDEIAFVAPADVSTMNDSNDDRISSYSWVADSATTSHITNQRSAFIEYMPLQEKKITGIGNIGTEAQGCGTIQIVSCVNEKNITITLRDTLYAPKAVNNLLSLSRLDEEGGTAHINDGQIILSDKNHHIIAIGKCVRRLYVLDARTKDKTNELSNTAQQRLTWDTLHRKYGHIGITGLKYLIKNQLVDGINIDENSSMPKCEACIQGKQTRHSFLKVAER